MFKMPGSSSGESASGPYGTLAVLIVFLLAILGFRSYITADKNIGRSRYAVPDANEQAPESGPEDPIRARVLKLREERAKAEAEARARGELPEVVPEDAGNTDTPYRGPTAIPIGEAEGMLAEGRLEDAAAHNFLPPTDEFRALELLPVLVWRARVADAVAFKAKLSFTISDDEGALAVVDADGDTVKVKNAKGEERTIAWHDVDDADLLELAKAVASERDVSPMEWLQLSQLSGMAGDEDAEGAYLEKALSLDSSLSVAAEAGPQVAVDVRVLNEYSWAWDDPTDPEPANSLTDDTPSIIHTYRYMRTAGLEKLREGAIRNPEYGKVLKRAPEYRGKAVRLEARYVKRFKSIRLTRVKQHLDAGIRDLDFCFVVDAHVRGIYLVSAPQDLREFGDSDIVTLTGVYVRRWPFIRHGRWKWIPWIAALKVEKFELAPIKGWRTATYLLVTGAAIVFLVIAYHARRDSKQGLEARDKLTKLRSGRDHIRRKVAEAMAAKKGASEGGATGSAEGASEGDSGSSGGEVAAAEKKDEGSPSDGKG